MKRKKILIITGIFIVAVVICAFCFFRNFTNPAKGEIKNGQTDTKITETKKEESELIEKNAEQVTPDISNDSEEIKDNNTSNNGGTNNYDGSEQDIPSINNSTPIVEENNERQCTVKKFYSVFRADFDNFEECNEKGNILKEKNKYYGFTCDYQTDDCGDIYYMLTFFDGNGNFIDYPSVPKS